MNDEKFKTISVSIEEKTLSRLMQALTVRSMSGTGEGDLITLALLKIVNHINYGKESVELRLKKEVH